MRLTYIRKISLVVGGMLVALLTGCHAAHRSSGSGSACAMPGKLAGCDEAVDVYLFMPKSDIKNNNGSFELGLGTADVWPGLTFGMPDAPPPLPQVVTNQAFDGTKSLCLTIGKESKGGFFYFHPPFLHGADSGKPLGFTMRVKASRPGVYGRFRLHDAKSGLTRGAKGIPTDWLRVAGTLTDYKDAFGIRFDISNRDAKEVKIWIDAVCWSVDKAIDYHMPAAEIILDPLARDGIIFAGKPLDFSWKYRCKTARKVETQLYIRDAGRRGQTYCLASRSGRRSSGNSAESFHVPQLPRGHYMAAAVVRDAGSGEILARDLQRFSVLSDLSKLKPTVDFYAGAMFVFEEPLGFTYPGMWSIDDMYRMNSLMGCRILRELHVWEKLEKVYGERDWDRYDRQMAAADKYGCGFMMNIPGIPIKVVPGHMAKARRNHFWPVEHGKLLGNKRRVVLDKVVADDDFVAICKKDTFWIPELDYMKNFVREFLTRYRKRGLLVVEFKNEVNAMVPAKINVEHLMKPLYPVMKAAAPDIPVLVNNTGGSGVKYLKRIIDAGGLPYMDGFSFHPYAWATLGFGSLDNTLMYRDYLDKVSPDRKLLLGQTEVIFTKSLSIQRVLSDWVGGCRWSCGLPWRGFYAKEHADYDGWHNSGPMVPGVNGVYLNGMSAALSGARLIGCVKTIPSTLIGLFDRKAAKSGGRYAVALCTKYQPGTALCLKNINLDGMHCKAYDCCGEPMALPPYKDGILLDDIPIYIRSDSPQLLEAFRNPEFEWVNDAQSRRLFDSYRYEASLDIVSGSGAFNEGCQLDNWEVVAQAAKNKAAAGTKAAAAAALQHYRIYPGSGNLIPEVKLDGSKRGTMRLRTTVWTRNATASILEFSSCGLEKTDIYLNGRRIKKGVKPVKGGVLGRDEHKFKVKLKAGRNVVELKLYAVMRRPAVRVALRPLPEMRFGGSMLEKADKDRRNLVISPGVLLSTKSFDKGKAAAYSPDSPVYKLSTPKDLTSYLSLRGDKKHDGEIIIEFADGKAHKVTSYGLDPRFNWFPKQWRFEGSNDARNWEELDDSAGYAPKGKHWEFLRKLEPRKAFKYYRFVFPYKHFMVTAKGLELYESL